MHKTGITPAHSGAPPERFLVPVRLPSSHEELPALRKKTALEHLFEIVFKQMCVTQLEAWDAAEAAHNACSV